MKVTISKRDKKPITFGDLRPGQAFEFTSNQTGEPDVYIKTTRGMCGANALRVHTMDLKLEQASPTMATFANDAKIEHVYDNVEVTITTNRSKAVDPFPNDPRRPTLDEIDELAQHILRDHENMDDAISTVERACIAVFDNYASDCVGYQGKLMTVTWPAGSDATDTFVWDDRGRIRLEAGYSK